MITLTFPPPGNAKLLHKNSQDMHVQETPGLHTGSCYNAQGFQNSSRMLPPAETDNKSSWDINRCVAAADVATAVAQILDLQLPSARPWIHAPTLCTDTTRARYLAPPGWQTRATGPTSGRAWTGNLRLAGQCQARALATTTFCLPVYKVSRVCV